MIRHDSKLNGVRAYPPTCESAKDLETIRAAAMDCGHLLFEAGCIDKWVSWYDFGKLVHEDGNYAKAEELWGIVSRRIIEVKPYCVPNLWAMDLVTPPVEEPEEETPVVGGLLGDSNPGGESSAMDGLLGNSSSEEELSSQEPTIVEEVSEEEPIASEGRGGLLGL